MQNGIEGDVSLDLPVGRLPEEELTEVKNMARFSQTKEFKRLKQYLESRIKFYQSYLPGNIPIVEVTDKERGNYWAVANLLISELQMVINSYESAQEEVSDARRQSS